MGGVWKVSEECMKGIMMVSRHFKNGVEMVNRGCLEANMQCQLEDKTSQDRSSHATNQDRLS